MNVIKLRRPAVSPEIDPSTLSNYQNFAVSNTELFLDVLFDEKIVAGTVLYHLEVLNKDVSEVILDTSFLTVESVTVNGSEAEFSLHERVEPLGSRLAISIPPNSQKVQLFISFRTTERCTAIQFLDKEATDGKKAPYLFCQCQAIHARS